MKEAQKFDVERFNLMKLSEVEFRKEYKFKFLNRLAALENLIVWTKYGLGKH
jgi:hypothetical protein